MGCLVSAEVECIQCSLFKKVIKPPLNITQLYQCNFDTESGKIHEKEWQSTFLTGDLNPVSWMTILFSNPWLSMTGNYLKMNSKYLRIDLRCHWLLLINYLNQIEVVEFISYKIGKVIWHFWYTRGHIVWDESENYVMFGLKKIKA